MLLQCTIVKLLDRRTNHPWHFCTKVKIDKLTPLVDRLLPLRKYPGSLVRIPKSLPFWWVHFDLPLDPHQDLTYGATVWLMLELILEAASQVMTFLQYLWNVCYLWCLLFMQKIVFTILTALPTLANVRQNYCEKSQNWRMIRSTLILFNLEKLTVWNYEFLEYWSF